MDLMAVPQIRVFTLVERGQLTVHQKLAHQLPPGNEGVDWIAGDHSNDEQGQALLAAAALAAAPVEVMLQGWETMFHSIQLEIVREMGRSNDWAVALLYPHAT